MHALARSFDARDRRVGGFVERAIRARGFADDGHIAFDVQQVILNLEREANGSSIFIEGARETFGKLRGASRFVSKTAGAPKLMNRAARPD